MTIGVDCGNILIRGEQYLLIAKMLVHGDVISCATGLVHYKARQFNTLLNVRRDVNSWMRVTDKINKQ